jgi:hypothetical protein
MEPLKDYDQEDEREAFEALEVSEQKAIRFLLDCAVLRPDLPGFGEWLAENGRLFGHARTLAAFDRLGMIPDLAIKLTNKELWGNPEAFFGGAVTVAVFCRQNDFIRTFAAFDFLFVRLLGGAVRPLTPSLFAATLLHPDCLVHEQDAQEFEQAMMNRLREWDKHEPVWSPNEPGLDCGLHKR